MKIRSIVLIASFVLLNAFLFEESYCQPPPQIEPEEGGRVVFHEAAA